MIDARNILVALPNWVGDAVMATPALRALRHAYPDASITLLGRPAILQVLGDDPRIGDVALPAPGGGLLQSLQTAKCIRRGNYDLAVLLPNSFRIAMLAWLGGVKHRAGYARDGRSWMLTDRLNPPRDVDGKLRPYPARDYYIDLVRSLGVKVTSHTLSLAVDAIAADDILAEAGYDPDRPLVVINPGGANNLAKLWLAERFAAVADEIADRRHAQIILNAAPNEQQMLAPVSTAMRTQPLLDFTKRANTLERLKALLGRADLLITTDTGARHIAAAIGTPVVTIFISTDPEWARIDYSHERIVTVNQPFQTVTAGSHDHLRVVRGVTVDMVLEAAEELLAAPGRPGGPASGGVA
jgi:heptosyltransferase-2